MSQLFNNFNAGKYLFSFKVKEPLMFPAYQGSMLKGSLLWGFKKLACIKHIRDECLKCELFNVCVFSKVFYQKTEYDFLTLKKGQLVLKPVVLEPLTFLKSAYEKGEKFEFYLTVFGDKIEYFPYFFYAINEAVSKGDLGKKGSLELEKVEFWNQALNTRTTVFHNKNFAFNPQKHSFTLEQYVDSVTSKIKNIPERIKISIKTPLRLVKNGKINKTLEFKTLISTALRRLKLLAKFHAGIDSEKVDVTSVVQKAASIQKVKSEVKWVELERFSSSQNKFVDMGGIVGFVNYKGNFDRELISVLAATSLIHIGKGTIMGLGKVEPDFLPSS